MSTQGISREFTIVQTARARWEKANKRVAIPTIDEDRDYALAVGRKFMARGGPRLTTASDVLPVVVIRGMPASMYPKHILHLAGSTLAAAAVRTPAFASEIWSEEWERLAVIVTATRVGVWAATGEVPEAQADPSSNCFRWSASNAKAIMRPAADCPGNEMFRYFASQAPMGTTAMIDAAKALMWIAPPMLLVAMSRVRRGEGSYTGNILEGVVKRHIRTEGLAAGYIDLMSADVWDAIRAAATAGYSLEQMSALAGDTAFMASSQLRVAVEGALQLRRDLEEALASTVGEESDDASVSDTASIADTEVGSPVISRFRPASVPAAIAEEGDEANTVPPPPLDEAAHQELVDAIRATKPMTPAWESIRRAPVAADTEVHF